MAIAMQYGNGRNGLLNVGMSMTLLWTNVDDESAFAAQTLSLSLGGYDAVLIKFKLTASGSIYANTIGFVGEQTTLYSSNASTTSYTYKRYATITTSDITFSTGYRGATAGTSYAIPCEVYGIKRGGSSGGSSSSGSGGGGGGTGTLTQVTFDGTVYTDDGTGNVTLAESDPVFVASDAYSITSTDITNWNNKSTFSGSYNDLTDTPSLSTVATSGDYADLSNTPTKLSDFTDDLGSSPIHTHSQYLTSYTETDPVFTASAAHGITSSDITAWNNKSNFSGSYNDLTNVPASFPPSAHSHHLADVTDVTASATEVNILDGATIPTADLNQAYQGIPYGNVTSDSTTVFTATVPGVTTLKDGTCCLIRNNNKQTSASGWTLNVNDLGAKPVYNSMADATRDTTIFNKVYTMLFVYDEDRVAGGCWICYRGYNSNDNTIGYQIRHNSSTLVVTQKTYRYRLLFSGVGLNTLVPANTSSSTSSTAAKSVNSTPINPFGPIYFYGYTSAVSADASPSAVYLWQQYAVNLGYSFTNATALALTSKLPVFLKCAPQNDGSAIIDSTEPIVQALPSSADGKIYILLGIAYSETNLELCIEHPVFYYDGTAIRLWTGASGSSSVAWSDITGKPTFATVATSGDYSDLSNTPVLATVATSGSYSDLSNTPSLAAVATSGNYSDLSNTPVLATVATSGSYNDLSNKPTIPTVPTNVSAFNNDAGYLTSYTETDPVFAASAAASITSSDISDWNGKVDDLADLGITATATELNYTDGVTSNIQDQLDAMAKAVSYTASGAIASFTAEADNMPVTSLVANIEPVQSGSGTPAPDNIRPISGWTGANVWDDPKHGGTIEWNQLIVNGNFADGTNNWDKTNQLSLSASNNKLTATASSKSTYAYVHQGNIPTIPTGHKVLISSYVTLSQAEKIAYGNGTGIIATSSTLTANTRTQYWIVTTISSTPLARLVIYTGRTAGLAVGETCTIEDVQVYDLTKIYGAGNEPTTFSAFNGLFPKNYYAYDTGTKTAVSEVNGDPYRHIQIDWSAEAGTVYGGTIDAATGLLTVTDGYIASYAGETLPSTWISDRDVYTSGTTPTTGAEVVYKLDTQQTYQLTPQQFMTLLGTNNVWADTGNVSVAFVGVISSYLVDKGTYSSGQLVQDRNLAYVESSARASRAYSVNNYFINADGVLCRITASVSSGGTLIKGTNYIVVTGGLANDLYSLLS